MKPTNEITCCVVDNGGSYVALAVRLAREYKTVYYTCPSWVDSYPLINKTAIGQGLDGIIPIPSPWPVYNEIDLWVFPDVYYGEMQDWLVAQGEIVWGSRNGEEMELYRDSMKAHMKSLGLPVQPYKTIIGFENLKTYLQEHDDVYVKINKWRGTVETMYSKNWTMIKPEIDEIEHRLEVLGDQIEFVIEDPVPDAVEIGYDGYTIDGQYPTHNLCGVEIKDKAYAGYVKQYSDESPLITQFNTAMADTFKAYGYRGFFSTEIRVDKSKTPYMIDMTSRMPCPPGEIYLELYENLGEVVWAGANGDMAEPKFAGVYACELLIESDWAKHHFQPVYFPAKNAQWIKLKKTMIVNGVNYCIPQLYETNDIGAVVGIGTTLDEAVGHCLDVAESIEGNGICIAKHALDDAQTELDRFEQL